MFASSFNAFAGSYMGKSGDWYGTVTRSATVAVWAVPTTSWWMVGILAYPVLAVEGFFASFTMILPSRLCPAFMYHFIHQTATALTAA